MSVSFQGTIWAGHNENMHMDRSADAHFGEYSQYDLQGQSVWRTRGFAAHHKGMSNSIPDPDLKFIPGVPETYVCPQTKVRVTVVTRPVTKDSNAQLELLRRIFLEVPERDLTAA